jgi:hypothetical protein
MRIYCSKIFENYPKYPEHSPVEVTNRKNKKPRFQLTGAFPNENDRFESFQEDCFPFCSKTNIN